jgi:hypothetical protein
VRLTCSASPGSTSVRGTPAPSPARRPATRARGALREVWRTPSSLPHVVEADRPELRVVPQPVHVGLVDQHVPAAPGWIAGTSSCRMNCIGGR